MAHKDTTLLLVAFQVLTQTRNSHTGVLNHPWHLPSAQPNVTLAQFMRCGYKVPRPVMSSQRRAQPPSRNSSMSVLFLIPPDVHQFTPPGKSTEQPGPSLPVSVQTKAGHGKAGSLRMSQEATVRPLNSPSESPLKTWCVGEAVPKPWQRDFDAANLNLGLVQEMGQRRARTASRFAVSCELLQSMMLVLITAPKAAYAKPSNIHHHKDAETFFPRFSVNSKNAHSQLCSVTPFKKGAGEVPGKDRAEPQVGTAASSVICPPGQI